MSELIKKLYEVTDEDVKAVKLYYERSEMDIRRDCWLIEAWMKKQTHLPVDYGEKRIERFLLRNKFRLEQTKQKLENYYTVRGFNIALLKNMDPKHPKMQKYLSSAQLVPMPKLMNNTERIYVHRFNKNDEDYSMVQNFLLVFAFYELELEHDYSIGVRFVADYTNLTSAHVRAFNNINSLAKMLNLIQECLSGRILGIHFVNVPQIFNTLLDIIKIAFTEKLFRKVTVHKDLNSLKSIVPEEYLPCDLEGKQRSCDEIFDDVKKILLENRDYLMKRVGVIADESKRVGEANKNELFGVDGSFKTIDID